MTDPDPAQTYERLRAETAEMLKLDAAKMSPVEGLQLDLVSLLRLEVDGLHGAALSGEAVDLQRLAVAHGLLAKMLPAQALIAPAAAADHVDQFAGARQELAALFEKRAEALERRLARDPDAARRELETKIQLAIEKHGGGDARLQSPLTSNENFEDPAGGIARHDGVVPLPALEPVAAASGSEAPSGDVPPPNTVRHTYIDHAVLDADPERPPVPTPISPLRHQSLHTSGEVPAHYLKDHQAQPAWRSFVDETGINVPRDASAPLKRGADWSPRRGW
jgi:hypothetical protein